MFKKGEFVFCGNTGICQIEGITTLDLDGVDNLRKYYLMHPVFSNGSSLYKPVDSAPTTIRPALVKKEAESLIKEIPSIDIIEITDEKNIEKQYKELIRSSDPKALISLIKTILMRKEARLLKGFKMTALDTRYIKLAEDYLYGELSVALDIPKLEVKDIVSEQF